jgi:hypothetical protein
LAYRCFPSTQVFTGAIPFNGRSSTAASSAIAQGKRPQRPTHPNFTEKLWTLMQCCWDQDPYLRPEISEILLVFFPLVSRSFWQSYAHWLERFAVCSEDPAWKRLTSHPLTTPERISLITRIFSDDHEVGVAEMLSEDDAQNFIDVVYGVMFALFDLWGTGRLTPALSIRRLIFSNHRSA